MKLASLRRGGRDGTLVVVNRALTHAVAVSDITPTLQRALDAWATTAPRLADVAARLEAGLCADAFPFDPSAAASPLPRAYQFLDGSTYLHHMIKARKARGAAMPENHLSEPLMYQGVSDGFVGPREVMRLPDAALDIDYEGEVAVITDDVPMGITAADAAPHIKLVMLLNDYTARALVRREVPKGFGFLQSKPTSACSPVAVTVDELGDAWRDGKLSGRLEATVNGRLVGRPDAGRDMYFSYPQLIAHAARTRALGAGTIIGGGAVSNQDAEDGHGCLAEVRLDEEEAHGAARTPWLGFGDVVRIDMRDAAGRSIFGAIEQAIERA